MNLCSVVLCLFTLVGFIRPSVSTCKVPTSSLNPVGLQGEITYNTTANRNDNCTWNLPRVDESKYVLFIYLKDMRMTYFDAGTDGCTGRLFLPAIGPICELPAQRCIVYSTSESSCTLGRIGVVMANVSSSCSSSSWHQNQSLPQTIRAVASQPDLKIFSLSYHYIDCDATVKVNGILGTTPTSAARETQSNTNNNTTQAVTSSSQEALIAVTVILSLVIIFVLLYFAYMRAIRRRDRTGKPIQSEYTAGTDLETSQVPPQMMQELNGNFATNEYEEISIVPQSNSREVVENSLY